MTTARKYWLLLLDFLLGCKWTSSGPYTYNGTQWRDHKCERCGRELILFADTPFGTNR